MNLTDSTNSILFTLVEVAIFVGSLGVILLPRVIYAALLLGFVFINVALLYLLLNADFLAAAQVLVYVGAINVLIVFAIMLVNAPDTDKSTSSTLGKIVSAITLIALFLLLLVMIFTTPWENVNTLNLSNTLSTESLGNSVNIIGLHLLTDLLLPFELLSLLLLVALVGAITIAKKRTPLV